MQNNVNISLYDAMAIDTAMGVVLELRLHNRTHIGIHKWPLLGHRPDPS